MQKFLFFRTSFKSYLIPILLLVSSFVLYSYSLESQPPHFDEVLYLAWGGVFFDSIKEGDFNNPCLKNIEDCESLFSVDYSGHQINYTPVRNFFTGLG